ncbi:MAG: hypothetical protein LBU43_05580, partial [Candidatus Accumulibacter sp.]|nr:hypothetical protein [Accumulibacter sp.]
FSPQYIVLHGLSNHRIWYERWVAKGAGNTSILFATITKKIGDSQNNGRKPWISQIASPRSLSKRAPTLNFPSASAFPSPLAGERRMGFANSTGFLTITIPIGIR